MRDDLSFAERLREDLRSVAWPEAAEIRARATRRRQRRTALGAAVVLLVVVSGVVIVGRLHGAAVGGPTMPGSADQPVLRAEIPQEALLDPVDVAVPSNLRLGEAGLDKPVRLDAHLNNCMARQGTPVLPSSRYSRSQTLIQQDAETGPAGVVLISQDLYRLAPESATGFVDRLGTVVAACDGLRSADTGWTEAGGAVGVTVTHHWRFEARDFAGDEAVLLRHVRTVPTGSTGVNLAAGLDYPPEDTLVVRVGDLVSVVVPASGLGRGTVTGPEASERVRTLLLELGPATADRMCLAANPACR